ncbi:hypothetical protein GGS21DRAFT_495118 [Xylaria nigripes]|nr:hypothetical protein GGS21DRAFT_495118 [Xylaria nigripes]
MSHYDGAEKGEGDELVSRPSRYRSLRYLPSSAPVPSDTKGSTSGDHHGPDQPDGHAAAISISRTMSRYRRRAPSSAGGVNHYAVQKLDASANDTPAVPATPVLSKTASSPPTPEVASPLSPRRQLHHSNTRRRAREASIEPTDNSVDYPDNTVDRNQGPGTMPSRSIRRRSLEQRDFSWEADRDRLLEEQKKKDLQRLEAELDNCRKNKSRSQKRRSPVVEKLVLLAKGVKSRTNKDEISPISPTANIARPRTRRSSSEPARNPSGHIEPGGKGIVPQKDAPTSAINAGERNVTVRWQRHAFSVSITPETTALDIIVQTSDKYDPEIGPEKYLVIERYGILGLERPLRRYERIRDVMNSWDRDTQNQLVVTSADPTHNLEDLDANAVSDSGEAPAGCQLYMYHSNRPGKWNKGWITLLESGQILFARKPNAKMGEKGTVKVCHLSDYDIYTPTESQIKKHIKSPTRLCFAIKSQHKTTVFLNTENYVQYFGIDDPQDADEFKQKVHGWRSWYLVDRRPEVRRRQNGTTQTEGAQAAKPTSSQSDNMVSADESPYSVGQFEPLIDMKRFDKRISEFGKDIQPPELNHASKQKDDQGLRRHISRREKPDYKSSRLGKGENKEMFGGLLGDEYDIRRQALADGQREQEPLTESPDAAPSWFPSAMEHTAKKRVIPQTTAMQPTTSAGSGSNAGSRRPYTSHHPYSHAHAQAHPNPLGSQPTNVTHSDRRGPPKPLVDLTPKIQEPPQWSQEKKGHGVKPPEGLNHLVDFISVGNGKPSKFGRHPEPPPRTVPRNAMPAAGSLGRTLSMSSASTSRRALVDDAPPVPSLPRGLDLATSSNDKRFASEPISTDGRLARQGTVKRDKEREREKARLRERDREQRREYRERESAYNAVPGRTGTLKVV